MGKVFTWSEVEDGRVPALSDYCVVIDKIKHDIAHTDGVIGGIMCGSALWGTHTVRSDIDCVVVYDPGHREGVFETLRSVNMFAARMHVPVELIPFDVEIARTTLNHIGLSFAAHLHHAVEHGGLIGDNPLSLFNFQAMSKEDDVREYLRNKLHGLEKGMSLFPDINNAEYCKFLQKVLEAPVHIARKIVSLHAIDMPDDLKQSVIRHYLEIANDKERELFMNIVTVDSRYTAELTKQLQGHDEGAYAEILEEVQGVTSDALRFVKASLRRLV